MKSFNITGTCRPNEHYMVDITERLEIIRKMVAKGDYFCINRGRQYGKTTTLNNLKSYLEEVGYCVFSISFEKVDNSYFKTPLTTGAIFLRLLSICVRRNKIKNLDSRCAEQLLSFQDKHTDECSIFDVSEFLIQLCADNSNPIVLFIDEVDQASEQESFLKLLGALRDMYLNRDEDAAFQSVILAGVYDIKNIKLKMRPEDQHQYNSPWNIAAPFDVDMSLSAQGIAGMLAEYKADYALTFDENTVAQLIRDYTSGYPFLVSRICQIIDTEQLSWDKAGVQKAVKVFLSTKENFWDDLKNNINEDANLNELLADVVTGKYICYDPYLKGMKTALDLDYVKRMKTPIEISSPLHECYLLCYCFNKSKTPGLRPPVVIDGRTLIEAIV